MFLFVFFQHNMYLRKGHSCYICTLSAQERLDVHTNGGIKNLEVSKLYIQKNFNGSNTEDSFTTAVSNLFLSPLEKS